MKKNNKYVKTRGQRLALQQTNSKPHIQLLSNKPQNKPSSAVPNNTNPVPPKKFEVKQAPKKTKKISKEQSTKQKQEKAKQNKQKIINKHQKKSSQVTGTISPTQKKSTKSKSPKKTLKIKLQGILSKQNKPTQSQSNIKGKTIKIKLSASIPKQVKSLIETEDKKVKKQHSLIKQQAQSQRNQQNSLPKPKKSAKKQSKGSKSKITVANQDSPSQQNNNSIRLESQLPKKRKGRPRKIIEPNIGTKIQERTLEEQKFLDSFVENVIKIRKLKNERQFFECFSRIIEYMRDSWEYGELSKMLKTLPRPEDILKIGIQLTRGIRKQLQIQAMNQAP